MKNCTLTVFLSVFLLMSCRTTIDNKTPIGETFPSIVGEDLHQKQLSIPDDLEAGTKIFLIGYVQDSQFDIDRWLIGLDMTKTDVLVYEIPTIEGMFPRMFKPYINEGMRRGIPKGLWAGVITIYKSAEKITVMTGTENPNNARVLLLDKDNTIRHFYDEGFSVNALNELRKKLSHLNKETG